jgi:tetratricopeptide (TPR) repeat protein
MKLFKRLLLALVAPVLFLAATELILRAFDYGYPTSFFVPAEINGRKVLTDNQFFGYRFFEPRITRTPPCIVLDREKAPGTVRVFVLGESAAMGEPLDRFGMARHLASQLESRYPGRRFEVVNAAMTAINSHVIVEIAREAARLQPDAFVLYIGNNEVVGPYGPGTVFQPFSGSRLVTRARVLATRLRLAQLLGSVTRRSSGSSHGKTEWEGLEMFAERKVQIDDRRLVAVRSQFRANIGEILDIACRAGAESVLCTVAVNLRDCPPFAGQDASTVYGSACALEAAGEVDDSRKGFDFARDLDTLRVRADSALNGILRELGTSVQPGVRFVDIERRFQALSEIGVPGGDYFLDHVHFNFGGNHELAASIAASMADLPALRDTPAQAPPSLSECRDRLLYTVWDELELTDMSLQRMRRPPFSGQPGNASRIEALIRHKMDLQDSARSVDLDELRPHYLDAIRIHPHDWFYPAGWGGILHDSNLYEESERFLRAALAMAPHRYEYRAALAMVLGFTGRARDGVLAILASDRKGGLFPALYLARTGRLLMENGRPRDAAEFLQEAMRRDPDNARAEQDLATCFVRLGRLPEAEDALRNVLAKQPDNTEALEDLAVLLVVDKRWDEAMPLFSRAMEQDPARPETRMKHALCFMYRGDVGRAVQELESLLRDSPDFAEGRFNMGLLYSKQRQWEYAATQFEKAVELRPDYADAWFQLARMRQAQGRDGEVREPLMNAVRLAPERKDFLDEWNRLYP